MEMIRRVSLGVILGSLLVTSAFAQSVVAPLSTTAAANSLTLASTTAAFYGFELFSGPTAGLAMVFASASVPSNGSVTPVKCYPVAANASVSIAYQPAQIVMTSGTTIVFGANDGTVNACFNLVKQNAAFISGEAQ